MRVASRYAARHCLALLMVALVPASSVFAQSSDSLGGVTLYGGEEFTIEAATKTELPISKAPGSVTVISARQIRETTARTIPELLRLVAGVNVRWNPMVQTVDFRSFGQNPFTSRVLLLIDGVPYNSWNKGGFPQHPGLDFFMMQNIKRLEIVRGPGSSLYGENAYWGVINIVTMSGEDLQGGRIEVSSGDLRDQSLSATYGKTTNKGSFMVSGRTQRGQLPLAFWTEDNNSEVQGSDIYIKGKLGNIEASYYRHEDDMDGFSNLLGFIPGASFRSAEKISQTVDIVAFKTRHEPRKDITFATDFSYAQRDGSRCAACHAAPQNDSFLGTTDHGYQAIGDLRLRLNTLESHDILLGVEARRVDAGDHTDQLLQPSPGTNVALAYTKIAGYVQDQISLAGDRLRLTLGARFDGSTDLFESELSPRIAAVYDLSETVVLRAGWSTAFRFPNFNELYQDSWFLSADTGFFAFPITVFEPNPTLGPEEIRTFDLGAEFRLNPSVKLKIDLFHSEVKDFVVMAFNGSGPTRIRFENHPGDATLSGGELEVRWAIGARVTGLVNWSYQDNNRSDTLLDSSGKPFEFVYSPQNKVNLAAYFGPFANFRGTIEAQWRSEQEGPSAWNFANRGSTATLGDYTLLNARLSWEAPVRIGSARNGLRFSLYGKNLLDDREIEETFLPIDMRLPGTTYQGTVDVRF